MTVFYRPLLSFIILTTNNLNSEFEMFGNKASIGDKTITNCDPTVIIIKKL